MNKTKIVDQIARILGNMSCPMCGGKVFACNSQHAIFCEEKSNKLAGSLDSKKDKCDSTEERF